jgi:hypothetical protein
MGRKWATVQPAGVHQTQSLPSDQDSNLLSRSCLFWLNPLILRGYREVLRPERIPRQPLRHDAETILAKSNELIGGDIQSDLVYWLIFRNYPPLMRIAFALEPFKIKLSIFFSVVWGLLNTIAKPLLVKLVIDAAASGDTAQSLVALGLYIAANILDILLNTWTQLLGDDLAAVIFNWLSSTIVQKSMRLAPGQGGNEAGLFSDMNRNMVTAGFLFNLPGCYVSLLAGLVLLSVLVSWPGVVGFLFLLALGKASTMLGTKSQVFAKKHLAAADRRLDTTKQMIEGVKAVKFLTWEQSFLDILDRARYFLCKTIIIVVTIITTYCEDIYNLLRTVPQSQRG